MLRKNRFKILSMIFIIFMISSCSSKDQSPPEERSVARWNALIKKDWDAAYSFQTPNYRKTYDSKAYRNSFGAAVEWKAVKLISVKMVEKNLADVKVEVKITFSEAGSMQIPSIIDERWQLIDGTWWFIKK